MEIKTISIISVFVAIVILLSSFSLIDKIATDNKNLFSTMSNEVFTAVSNVSKHISQSVFSVLSMDKLMAGSASNNVALAGFNGSKSLSTNHIATGQGTATLNINCEKEESDNISASIGSHLLGYVVECPDSLSSINASWLSDPATAVFFINTGANLSQTDYNDTALAQANSNVTLLLAKTPINATFNISIIMENSNDRINISVNGHNIANLTNGSNVAGVSYPYAWFGTVNNFSFQNNGTTSNITNVSVSYQYHKMTSNLTNMTLTYNQWIAYSNYTLALGNLTMLANGTYQADYRYISGTHNDYFLLMLIPMIMIVGLLYLMLKEIDFKDIIR